MTDRISFENAPLIEIVAELRWLPPGARPPAAGEQTLILGGADHDTTAMTFGRHADIISSFTLHEKLVPPNFPAMWHQPVWRFKDPREKSALLQIGPGIFTANAVQPYKRWTEFRPILERGVNALIASRPAPERQQPFTGLTLRYINAFTDKITEGQPAREFARGILGFDITVPQALTDLGAHEPATSINLSLLIPIANTSKTMAVQVANASVQQEGASVDALVLDWNVAQTSSVGPTAAAVLAAFDQSHDIIHDTFLKVTEKIKDRMKPEGSK